MYPLVSIVIPARNAEKYISECLYSCIQQTYLNIEIILVDDGSVDETVAIASQIAKKQPRIKIIRQVQQGVTVARNCGLEAACGKFLFFLDADDSLPKLAIETLVKRALSSECMVVIGCIDYVSENGDRICLLEDNGESVISNVARLSSIRRNWMGHLAGILYDKNLFNEPLQCPKELRIGEDLLQTIQILFRCNRVATVSEIVYNYIHHNTSTIHSRPPQTSIEDCPENMLVCELMALMENNKISKEIQSEIELIQLFSVLNMPENQVRSKLIRKFRFEFLKSVFFHYLVLKKICMISCKLYLGVVVDLLRNSFIFCLRH